MSKGEEFREQGEEPGVGDVENASEDEREKEKMAEAEERKVLSLETAGKCLSCLGKIWNLTECPEGCEVDSLLCQTSDERLLDMEGYVEEYQYLKLTAVDMGLTDIRIIPKHFVWLLSVDLSGNKLTNVTALPLAQLPNLVSLKLNRNGLTDPYLQPMKNLQYLSLASNEIDSIHRVYHPNLLTLDVSHNKIAEMDAKDCWKLKHLRKLELRGNQLTTTKGIEYPELRELYLAENQIERLDGLQNLPSLERLHVRSNPLAYFYDFDGSNNINLRYVNIRSCRIADPGDLRELSSLTGLRELVIKDNLFNPAPEPQEGAEEEEENEEVRLQILVMMPELKRIDKKAVTREEIKRMQEMLEEAEAVD